jgi:hypothetical protein
LKASGFLSSSEIDRFLAFAPREVQEITLELRELVAAACPHATESVLWGSLSYHNEARGGRVKGAICLIEFARHEVRLSFIHGARLADPEAILTGHRLSKRYVPIRTYDGAPWEAIRGLIQQAAGLDPSTLAPLVR